MGRILLTGLFILFGIGLIIFTVGHQTQSVITELPVQSAAVLEGVNQANGYFSASGTLTFYPNNVGPVPYLFYQDQKGKTVAKALAFVSGPPVDFSTWSGAHIRVTGTAVAEHVVVSTIEYLSGP